MNRNSVLVCACFFALIGCGDELLFERNKSWDIKEDYTVEFRHGIYKSSVEIIEDTCTPSLRQIIDTTPLWPPVYSAMPSLGYGSHSFIFQIYNLRSAGFEDLYGLPTRMHKIREGDVYTTKYPEDYLGGYHFSNNFTSFCEGLDGRDYSSKRTIRSVSSDQFEIEIEDKWSGFVSCDHQRAMQKHVWFPRSVCEEHYKIVYTIEEDIPRSCRMDVSQTSLDLRPVDPNNPEGSFYPYLPRETIEVVCDQI